MSGPVYGREPVELAEAQTPCPFCLLGAVEPIGVFAAGGTTIYWRARCRLCGQVMILRASET